MKIKTFEFEGKIFHIARIGFTSIVYKNDNGKWCFYVCSAIDAVKTEFCYDTFSEALEKSDQFIKLWTKHL